MKSGKNLLYAKNRHFAGLAQILLDLCECRNPLIEDSSPKMLPEIEESKPTCSESTRLPRSFEVKRSFT